MGLPRWSMWDNGVVPWRSSSWISVGTTILLSLCWKSSPGTQRKPSKDGTRPELAVSAVVSQGMGERKNKIYVILK